MENVYRRLSPCRRHTPCIQHVSLVDVGKPVRKTVRNNKLFNFVFWFLIVRSLRSDVA